MRSRRATPTTPFIPPLGSPEGSPNSAPVIPNSGSSPHWSQMPPPAPGGGYPVYSGTSPYVNTTPFIPQMSPGATPAVFPSGLPPQQRGHSSHSRQGVSEDYIGYPQGTPYTSPTMPPQAQYPPTPYQPFGPQPSSPWHPGSAPAQYPAFGGTPWAAPPAAFPTTPWGVPQGGLPPQAYTPAYPSGMPLQGPPPGWGGPHLHQSPYFQPPPLGPSPWMAPGMYPHPPPAQSYFPPQPPPRAPPEPPIHMLDRMDPFAEGDHYGPVLDPFLVRVLGAQVKINPLIQPLPEDGSDQVHLIWNMLYPTSTVQRSTDPSHISWSKGRNAPATFPRVTSLRLVTEAMPWMISIKASDKEKGVTCAEVIDAIGYDLNRLSKPEDFKNLSHMAKRELTAAYHHNRSRSPGVPGGQLGEGLKRLDFLRKNTMFAGIEVNDRKVKRLCGDVLPCVFVLKCSPTFLMTKQEVKDQETRMRANSAAGTRSRANSTNTRITVHSPSSVGDGDSPGLDQ